MPGVAALVAGAALVFQAPQLVTAVARGCVTPGVDGPNATLAGVVNSYYPAAASAAAGATTISLGARIAGAPPAIAAGDLLLVIQMQDADISGTNAVTYGDGATGRGSTALRSTGLYEYVSARSAVVAGVVTIAGSGAGNGLVNTYDFSAAITATHGVRTFQVIRVPQYSSATLGAGLTAAPWNGAVHAGGVLAIDVAGALNLNAQTISVDQLGFKGALGVAQVGGPDVATDYVVASGRGDHGYKGEGVAGTPHFLYDAIGNLQVTGAADGYPSGDAARGGPGTAGGGGDDSHPVANDQNSGGGGGANGGQGGLGGNTWNGNQPVGGLGGAAFVAAATKVVLGGGGGAGARNNSATFASSGGTGGGIVMIRTGSLAGTATITANGGVGFTPVNDGGGGGGAGGSVVVTTNAGTVNGLTIHANGGNGTNAWPTGPTGAANYHGPGGGGGGGVIITSNALPPAQATVTGGVHGTTTVDAATYGSVSGAVGQVLTTTPAAIPGSSSGAECLPVLTVTKTTSTPNVTNTVAGTTATYTITVGNAANTAAATSVSISDALPAGFTYASTGSVVLSGGATRPATVNPVPGAANPAFGTFTIPASGSVAITFTVNVAASVAPGTYNNPATATYLDPTRTAVAGTTSAGYAGGGAERVTVHASDMTIAKSHADPLVRGSTSTYTLTATNSGNVVTGGTVTVTDTLPAGLTPTGAAGTGWTCPAPVGQTVTCTRADALAGGSAYPPITVTVTVLQGAANSVTNQASVSGGGQTNTTNDTASDLTNIVSRADIALTKTVSNATPNQGTNVTFTVTATNNGPSNATGVQVTDLLPAGVTFVSAVPSVGTYTSATGLWNIGPLASGANATVSITATVTGTALVTNTATKTAETETDPVAGNNSASATVTGQAADIAMTKTVSNATPNVGANVTFTVTATNNGPSNATGVQVTDLLPAGLTFVSAAPSVGTYTSGTGLWNIGPIAGGANATLSVVATVTGTTLVTNTATKTAEVQPDPTAGNNAASAAVTGQAADIAVTKTVSNTTPNFGANVTFTITATNNGPSNSTGVQVTDLLPAGLSFVSSAPSVGSYTSGTGLWNIGLLGNGASATLAITATVNTSSPTTNTATRTAENQPDPTSGNDSESATVTPVAADIAVTKAVDNTRPNQNTNVTFTITATNNGPSNATGVQVTDLLPPGLSFVSAAPSVGTSYNQLTGVWTIGALANPGNATLSIIATATGTTAVTNTATKSAEVQADPVAGNNAASATVTGQAADIAITKIVGNATPDFGSNVTFTVTATNNGPNDAAGVQVTDSLPAGLTFVSAVASVGTYNSGSGIWNIGALANGASGTLSIVATVNTTAPATNTATKTAEDQPDPAAGNNSASATVTPVAADIAVAKSVNNPTPVVGTNVTYTVTATNNGPSSASGVVVTDLLPAGLTFVSAAPSVGTTYVSGTGIWTIGALANGANATLSIVATVNVPTSITNTATKTAEVQPDPGAGNDSASVTVSGLLADIAVTKTVDNPTPDFGFSVTYTVTATNNGPSNASGVVVTDLLPAGLTFVSATPSVGTNYVSGTGLWNIGGLTNATSATLTITATVNTLVPTTNTATKIAENEADNNAGNNSASTTITPLAADIAVTKTVSNTAPNQNTDVIFTITATNQGPSDATGVQVTDLLPPGLTYVSAVTTVGAYNSGTGVWDIGALANSDNGTLSIVATVNGITAVTNTATKTAETQSDPAAGNNTATATVTGRAADIAITKIVDNPAPNLGSNITFTITATNNGPSDATGVEITDSLPAGLTFVSAVPSVGTYVSGTGIWHIGGFTNGASATLSIIATVNTTSATTNTATSTAGNQPDPLSGNDSASATVTGQSADIGLTKSVDSSTPNFGTNVTFTITATNNGPSNATGVQVSDLLPAGLTFVSAVPGVGTYSSGTGIWDIGALGNGATGNLAIVATVNTTTPTTNTATKTLEDQPDLVAANNTASASVTPRAVTDIAVGKAASNLTPDFGTNVTFTVTAINNGPNAATGVQVTDLLPVGLTFVSATTSGATTYSSGTGIWDIGPLAGGTGATLTITATVNTTAPTTNTATKTAGNELDPTTTNDSASATITPVAADIAITKTVDNTTPNQNANVTFTVTATNNGPSNATGVVVSDPLPAGLSFVSATPSGGTTYNPGTGVWTIGAIANGANATLSIVATATGTTLVTNTATTTIEDQPDPAAGNNAASATVTGQAADIAITKTVSNPTPNVGANVTFTVTATNTGPSSATGVVVTDLLPAGLTLVSATPSGATTYSSGTGVWAIGPLANGANATLSIVATVNTAAATTNTATKTAEDQTDLVAGNNAASATVTGQSADIAVTKSVDNPTPNQNTDVTFTVTATNVGPSNATGVVVTDLLPAGLTFVSATPSGATTYDPVTGVWNIGSLVNGANGTLSIVATATGTNLVTNTATKTAEAQPDSVAANNSATSTVTGQSADIAVAKIVDKPTPNLGSNVTFTVTVHNNGPSSATGVVVSDLLPGGLSFVSALPSLGTYDSGTGVWNIGGLANGSNATLSLVATVTTTATTTNTATKTGEVQLDPAGGNNSASAAVTGQTADIALAKTVSNATPNQNTNVTFTVTATNNGPSNATGVQVTDLMPAGLTFSSAAPSVGTTYNPLTGVWNIGALANGANATVSIVATVTGTTAVTNTAAMTAEDQPDAAAGNDTASVTVTGRAADIAIAKIVNNPTPNLGANVTFTVGATNNGPSDATGVQVTDLLPAGLAYVSAVPSAGTSYDSVTGIWTIGPLVNGASATIAITATVNTTVPTINTASKTAEDQPDPVVGNNSASTGVNAIAADIAVSKTVSNTVPNQNTNVTFTITAKDNGPSTATGVQVTDLLPAGLTFVSSASSQGTYNAGIGLWDIGVLANGSSATLAINATVTGTTTVTNTATKTAEDQPDPGAGNNSASATVTGQAADIAILKTASNSTPTFGTNVTFTVTATNTGPSNATSVQVTDLLPAGLTFVSAVQSVGTYTPATGLWNIGSLANASSATLAITATVNTLVPTTNTATKTAENQPDPVTANNSASATINPVAADIAIAKTVSNTAPNQNTDVTFTITATNNGPSNATGVVVTDLLPGGLTFVSAAPSAGTTYNQVTGLWTIGAVANGANATLSVVATVTGTAAVTNTASRSAGNQPDPISGNDTASATVTGQAADIAVTKAVSNPTPGFGSNVTFTVTATDSGPGDATGVQVTDLLPAGLTFVSAAPSGATTYNPVTGVWDIGPLAGGTGATLAITATINTTTPVTNTATKTAEDQPDSVTGNDSANATVTPVGADIAITKTVSDTTPNQNTNVTFTITATNNGPSNATGVVVTDVLPAGLSFFSAAPSVGTSYNQGLGVWTIGALANPGNATLSIVATVTGTTAVTNTATRSAGNQPDPVAGNNTASATVTGQAADIAVTKVVDNPTPDLGANVTFTITATNNGPSNATGVEVTDSLPAGLTFVSMAPSVGTTYNSGSGVWNIGTLTNGGNATLSITAKVTTTAAATNVATRTAGNLPDPVPGNDSAGVTITPVSADIAITKTVDNSTPTLGTNVTFTITATNNGPSNATGVVVTDLLPAGLTFVSAAPSVGTSYNQVLGVWTIGTLANPGTATLTITTTVTGLANSTNTATKTAEDQVDPVTGNDSASSTVACCLANIAVAKTVDNPAPNFGSNVTYTVTATNNGPAGATGVVVTDQLPAGLTFVSAAPSVGTTYVSGTGLWNIGGLTTGTSATLTITATVNTLVPTTNTATKTAENEADNNAADDSASATVTPVAADIAITKTVSDTAPNQNANVTFTITATNHGPAGATGVVVTDLLPAGLSVVSAVPTVGAYNSGTGAWNIGALANGANGTLSIVATVTGTTAVTNTAAKTAEAQSDPAPGNDSASATVTGQAADIGLTKIVDNATPSLGSNVTFTVTATNHGPSDATGVEITDSLPAGLTFVSATASTGAYNSGTGLWNIGSLANGANATLTIVATVNTTTATTNTAGKTAEDQPDPTAGNNSASAGVNAIAADIAISKTVSNTIPNQNTNVIFTITATDNGPNNATGVQVTDLLPAGLTFVSSAQSTGTYNSGTGLWDIGPLANGSSATMSISATVTGTTAVTNTATKTAEVQSDPVAGNDSASATVTGQAANIAITKTVSNPTPNFGANVTFTVTATNTGPSNATGVEVTDSLPAGLTFVSAAPSGVTTYNSGTGIWTIGPLANGASATLSIVATVNTTLVTTNTATKTAENQPDPVAGNDAATATITPVAADIAIAKTVSDTTPNQNTNVTFTVIASNNGPSSATGVVVTDLLPAGLSFVSAAPSVGTSYNQVTGLWTIGAVANGANATLSIVATATGTTAVTNTATRSAGNQPDPIAGNDSASATVTGQAADIAIVKTVSSPAVPLGSNVIFVVTATNNGPSDATGVQVTDSLPAGLTLVSATPSAGTTYNPGTGVWNIGALARGAQATISIVAQVTVTTPATNTATKTAEDQSDSVPGNDSASATVTGASADITVTKTVNRSTPKFGQNVTYKLVVHNLGPSTATGVRLRDLLPAGVKFVSYSATQGTYNPATGIWNVGTMVNGSTVTLSVIVKVTSSGPIVNTITTLAGGYFDPNLSNNVSSAAMLAGLPGLPNTSAPDGTAGGPGPAEPQNITGVLLAILLAVAGLGAFGLAGIGRRRHRATFGQRRSRSSQRQTPSRLAIGLLAVSLSLAIALLSVGELASYPTGPVAGLPPGTQLIGSKVVTIAPPAAPKAESFHRVAGPITPSRIRIPSIGVDAWIGAVGLLSDGSMDVPDNLWTSSWLETGPRPGQAGNAVIAGHRGVGTPALFSHLEKVQPGDRIYVSDASGNELIYLVTRVASLDLSASTQVAVFEPTTVQQLVLITCFGRFLDAARTYDHRLVVFSRPLPPAS